MDYSIAIGHLRFASAGLIDPGPPRPPYLYLPDEYRAGGIECGRRWGVLQQEFQARNEAA
jgi:4-(2-carboxyphenyl)-2-oxobut-3-enoate aldolase